MVKPSTTKSGPSVAGKPGTAGASAPFTTMGGTGKSLVGLSLAPIPMPGMTHVLIPYNSKGGVGKSFIALTLAAGIKTLQPGARVLLIDATQDQSTHSADFAPENEVNALGLGAAIGSILLTMDSGEAKARKGVDQAQDIIERALTKVSVRMPEPGNDGLVDFLPNAADEIIYHSKAWSTLPNPEVVIHRLLEPLINANRWDWIVVDLPAALDGISMRGFLPCASAVVIPEDVRHTKNLSGLERTVRTLRKLPMLRLVGFLPNFKADNDPCRTCLNDLNEYAKTLDVPVLTGLPHVTTLTKSFDTVYVSYPDGQEIVGSGIYHLLHNQNPMVRNMALQTIPVVEEMTRSIMEAAISTEQPDQALVEA